MRVIAIINWLSCDFINHIYIVGSSQCGGGEQAVSLDRERARKLVGRTWQSGPRRPKCRGIDLAATHLESCLTSVHCLANAGCTCRDNRTFQVTYAFKDMIHGDGFLGQESDHTFGNERDQELGRYRCHRWNYTFQPGGLQYKDSSSSS